MTRVGILGGTFNPPHNGHLRLAKEFAGRLSLDEILVIPTFLPPHKEADESVTAQQRLALCRLCFGDDPLFSVSDLEIRRGGKSYTFHTLEELRKTQPDAEFFLLIGSDMFFSFHRWYNSEGILDCCTLCAAARLGTDDPEKMRRYIREQFPYRADRIILSGLTPMELSSTELRARAADGEDLTPFVGKRTAAYIREKGLYHAGYTAK